MRALLDTNILILHISSNILATVPDRAELSISTVTIAEALRYPGLSGDEQLALDKLIHALIPVNVDSTIARRAAALGRTRVTKLPDLIIAATALELNIPLITRNIHDFKSIPGLEVKDKI